jgi:ribosomal protein S18 acetylase RimI-like enzyme
MQKEAIELISGAHVAMNQSEKLQSYLRESARAQSETVPVPPFTLFLHATDKSRNANVLIPDSPIRGDIREVLRRAESLCAAHACQAHIRFLSTYAPELPLSLQACGYDEAESLPVLICTSESYRPADPVPGLEMITVSQDSSLEEVKEGWNTNALGYDLDADLATDEQAEAFRQSLEGCRGFTARLHGQAVGAGMFNPIKENITELVGITTLAPFRRCGIATYLTAFATQVAFALGAEMVFLIAENAQAQRVYERVGYDLLTTRLIYQAKA